MVAVLLVLMALFVLSAPYLVTVRNADQASSEASDRSVLRVQLDAAGRHGVATLAASHPALDETPYHDDLAELTVTARFPEGFLATDDPRAVMWGIEAEDLAGRIDLGSASPHVLANLIGGATRLAAECKEADQALALTDAAGFLPEGVVLVDDEWMGYAELDGTRLAKLARGLLVKLDADGQPAECGPRPPGPHEVGAFVLDQRAFGLCEWRTAPNLPGGRLRAYERIEEAREAADFMLGPGLGRDAYLALERTTSGFARVRAGAVWQRPARVLAEPGGEPQYGCKLRVDDARWFNPGTTVWITDGTNEEYAMVRSAGGDTVVLLEPLRSPYEPYRTLVHPLARTPVNVNTAKPEVLEALWTNLKLRARSARITAGEAEQLVELAVVSRPFTGFEDFLRRLVLPAAGLEELPADAPIVPERLEELGREASVGADGKKVLKGFIDPDDARALYKNALNANDNELEFATMPLCFTSRDVYGLSVRAAVNAPSGTDRARGQRELVELVVPQRDLLTVWTRQEDFDEAPRLDLAAAGWLTGPTPTSRHDALYGEVTSLRWPTRARAHLGPHDTQAPAAAAEAVALPYTFAVREDEDGWAQLQPYREQGQARGATYALHFDDETKTLEGRFLPDEPAELDLAKLGWSGAGNLMSGVSASLWLQPRGLEEGALLLDVAGAFTDADRVSLLYEGGNLVLRVLDGAGEHPTSTFKERSEIRFPLAGEGPGLPLDTWSHVQVAVDGNRPDQMALWVDGRRSSDTPGLTRLTGALSSESDTIQVESTEGFPDQCVLRIGEELIEATKLGPKSFRARFQATGEHAGWGGRLAREEFSGYPETNVSLNKATDHPSGSTVQLYGYSAPLFSNVPNAAGSLSSDLGMFAVAYVEGIVVDGSEKRETSMEPITPAGSLASWGYGFTAESNLEGLLLVPADPERDIEETMAAFSPTGGYAAILGAWLNPDVQGDVWEDANGDRIGGIEIIRYSGWDGQVLEIAERGGAGLKEIAGGPHDGAASFLLHYALPAGWVFVPEPDPPWEARNQILSSQTMVIPISIPVRGGQGVTGFDPANNGSAFAQITRSGGESHFTEWVRYDEIVNEHLVRDDPDALLDAQRAAHGGGFVEPPANDPTRPTPPNIVVEPVRAPEPAPAAPPSSASSPRLPGPRPQRSGGSYWDYLMGEPEDVDFPVARAVNSQFQFRGVMGTFCHAQAAGTLVLPVFFTRDYDATSGWPGRFDHVMFVSEEPSEPGFPGVVHRAHRPNDYVTYAWDDGGDLTPEASGSPVAVGQTGFETGVTYVALDDRLDVPFVPTPIADADGNPVDTRRLARMTLFPSGELPREVQKGQLGGEAVAVRGPTLGRSGGAVPSAVVDEALFFPSVLPTFSGMPVQLVVTQAFDEGAESIQAWKDMIRTPLGDYVLDDELSEAPSKKKPKVSPVVFNQVLAKLPERGGCLRIGEEILCYDSFDASGNTLVFTLAPAGRGLLGTDPQPHQPTESITYLGALPVAILAANVRADDAELHLTGTPTGFPSHGLVRIEDELVHYTSLENGVLRMPRGSSEPGEKDGKGPGLFRGRFGTQRADHPAGAAVVLHPVRYWDCWSELADVPELTYFSLSCEQPDAYWRRVFWKGSAPAFPGPELGVLQRTSAETPWDAVPEPEKGLALLFEGKLDGEGNRIEVQSDRIEWRVFVRHLPGSYDPLEGLAHGWKTTPRLELFGVEYMGPSRTFARVDR